MTLLSLPQNLSTLLSPLLNWYKKNGRHDMPWRKTEDPYAILVSEYMLQQTTVAAVKPYYERFLKKFPTLASLASAPLDEVLALWSGLGYYARARNLWAAMKMVKKEFAGKIPSDQFLLQRLPGIGLYTSGAISSLAFDKPAVVLDGNIIRVLMRLLSLEEDPRLKAVQVILRKLSLDLTKESRSDGLPSRRGPHHTVLALMDLGATICLPQQPLCSSCPLNSFCLAYQHGNQNQIPAKGDEIERPRVRRLYALIQNKQRWLLGQRPKEGLFGGLWEFPGVDVGFGEDPVEVLEAFLKNDLKAKFHVVQALKPFEHQLSHRDFSVRPFLCASKKKSFKPPKSSRFYRRFSWVSSKKTFTIGLSAITKKIFTQIRDHDLEI